MGLKAVLVVICVLYAVFIVFRRLYFDRLSHFPGPKRAAVSVLYEFYHDAIRGGQYFSVIKEMHKNYGPIVRISPDELHVSDPSFIKELYTSGNRKRNKPLQVAHQFGVPDSTGGSPDHDLHRLRRASLANFFSKASISKIEPLILETLSTLSEQIEALASKRQSIELTSAFSCMTADIVHVFAFGKTSHFLLYPDFETPFSRAFKFGFECVGLVKHTPWLFPLIDNMSDLPFFKPTSDMGWLAQWRKERRDEIDEYKQRLTENKVSDSEAEGVLGTIISSDLPSEEKETSRVAQEAAQVIAAGTETTAWVLSFMIYQALVDRTIMRRLREELQTYSQSESSPPPLQTLQNLPYLISQVFRNLQLHLLTSLNTAVVSEGLRLGFGVCARLARIAPEETLVLRTSPFAGKDSIWEIPPGTTVSMSSALIHMDPQIFPDPEKFLPERWIEDRRLDQYLLSFSKGSRQCLGINLAYAELYICLAEMVWRFGDRMSLYNTTADNVEFTRDSFVPYPRHERKVEVMVTPSV